MFPNINLYVQFLLVISKNSFFHLWDSSPSVIFYNCIFVQIEYETTMLATCFPLQY